LMSDLFVRSHHQVSSGTGSFARRCRLQNPYRS